MCASYFWRRIQSSAKVDMSVYTCMLFKFHLLLHDNAGKSGGEVMCILQVKRTM